MLDKNFRICIHGYKDLIEKGFDDGNAMNYYKICLRKKLNYPNYF